MQAPPPQQQADYITLPPSADPDGKFKQQFRRSSLGEAIITGGADMASINTYLQDLAAKAKLKRKEQKKKRKERKTNKEKKRSKKRSRSCTLPDHVAARGESSSESNAEQGHGHQQAQQQHHDPFMPAIAGHTQLRAREEAAQTDLQRAPTMHGLCVGLSSSHPSLPLLRDGGSAPSLAAGSPYGPLAAGGRVPVMAAERKERPRGGSGPGRRYPSLPRQDFPAPHVHEFSPTASATLDDSILSSFLSADLLQDDDMALLSDLL